MKKNYVQETNENLELWKSIISKTCTITEGISTEYADNFVATAIAQRHYLWLIRNEDLKNIYYSFALSVGVEFCQYNKQELAISFATAILDNWFLEKHIDNIELKKQFLKTHIIDIFNDRERMYREFFLLYNDSYAKDVIRVFYPKNGQNWIEWDKEQSIKINVNLSKGLELGFCRCGFSYSKICDSEHEQMLKAAYLCGDREILRFKDDVWTLSDNYKVIWAY